MKKFFLAICVLFFSSLSLANPCVKLSSLGAKIMEARQNNVPKEDVLIAVRSYNSKDINNIVEIAYKHPAYRVEANKEKAISDFSAVLYKVCIEDSPRPL